MATRRPAVILSTGLLGEVATTDSIGGVRVVTDATTARTLTAADDGCLLWFTSSSSITVTVPQQSTEAIVAGFGCGVIQGGTGQITFAKQGTDTLASEGTKLKTAARYSGVAVSLIIAAAPATWWIGGGIVV